MKKIIALMLMLIMSVTVLASCGTAESVYVALKSGAPTESTTDETIIYDGRCYQRIEVSMTWNEAKAYCESLGGHLVTIMSKEEDEIVRDLVSRGEKAQYWLGGTKVAEDTWIWVTGEEMTYFGDTVTFNNHQGNEYYLQMQRHHWGDESYLGFWNDINNENSIQGEESFFNNEMIGIICEWGIISSD